MLNLWFNEVPLMEWRYYYGTFQDNLFNTTHEWANVTNAAMVCFDVTENLAIYTANKLAQFPDFTTMLMAFFQNLLGSITTLISIYNNVSTTIENGNLVSVFTQAGRALNILLSFQPISDSPLAVGTHRDVLTSSEKLRFTEK